MRRIWLLSLLLCGLQAADKKVPLPPPPVEYFQQVGSTEETWPLVKAFPSGAIAVSGNLHAIGQMLLSPDGRLVAAAGSDGRVRIFETERAGLVQVIEAHRLPCE